MARGWVRFTQAATLWAATVATLIAAVPIVLGGADPHRPPVLDRTDAGPSGVGRGLPLAFGAFSVAILPSRPQLEPGLPVWLNASITGGTPPFGVNWTDSGGRQGSSLEWESWAPASSNFSATCWVTDSVGGFAAATETLPVFPAPVLTFSTAWNASASPALLSVPVEVSGGLGPYELTYGIDGDTAVLSERLPTAGQYVLQISTSILGLLSLEANVTDSLGGQATGRTFLGPTVGPPTLTVAPPPYWIDAGTHVEFSGEVAGGVAPIHWSISITASTVPLSPLAGNASTPGVIDWTTAFLRPGNFSVLFTATDSLNRQTFDFVPVSIQPAILVNGWDEFRTVAIGDSALLGLAVSGGVPPYHVVWWASDGESGGSNLSLPGVVSETLLPSTAGNLTVHGVVEDLSGATVPINATLAVIGGLPVDTPGATVAPSWTWFLGVAVVSLGLGGFLLRREWRRRHGPSTQSSTEDAVSARIRRLIEDSGGLETETLYLLAEEQGVSKEQVDRVVERARLSGQLEIEGGPEGEPMLRWITSPHPVPKEAAE